MKKNFKWKGISISTKFKKKIGVSDISESIEVRRKQILKPFLAVVIIGLVIIFSLTAIFFIYNAQDTDEDSSHDDDDDDSSPPPGGDGSGGWGCNVFIQDNPNHIKLLMNLYKYHNDLKN